MNCSPNEMILNGGHSTNLSGSCGAVGTAAASPGNRPILKELNTNGSNTIMLGSLSPKSALNNNSKLLAASPISNVSKISAAPAAGSANSIEYENNSFPHELQRDAEAKKDFEQQHKEVAKDQLNDSGVNTSSNKFVGLTEYDEAKIPELPCDLNPNIEEEYNVTFEECFMPSLNAQQGITVTDKTQALLYSEADITSSDNETFTDCYDEKDPLASTFAEPSSSLNMTTELESFQSAGNRTLSTTFCNTMENIADITIDPEIQPLKNNNKIELVEQQPTGHVQTQLEHVAEDEPMDVDMNATLEIIQNTSSNIQNVEKVLQHAEHILQHLDDKNESVALNKENEKASVKGKLPDVEQQMERSTYDVSVNKSLELPVNKSKTLGLEIAENLAPEQAKNESDSNLKSTNDVSNLSDVNKSSGQPAGDGQTEAKLNSINSQKISPSNSPSFPTRPAETAGFPQSPKLTPEKQAKSFFLEKSDYLTNLETRAEEEKSLNDFNETCIQVSSDSAAKNLEPITLGQDKRRTFSVDTTMGKVTTNQEENNREFEKNSQTFNVKTNENVLMQLTKFPSLENAIDKRRTFSVNVSENTSNETVLNTDQDTIPNEQITGHVDLNTSCEPMDVDDHIQESTTLTTTTAYEEEKQKSQSPPLPIARQEAASSLAVIEQKPETQLKASELDLETNSQIYLPNFQSQSPPPPTMQAPRALSPPLPARQPRPQSPPIPIIQPKTQPSALLEDVTQINSTPPEPIVPVEKIKQEQISPLTPAIESNGSLFIVQPLSTLIQKRPPIRDARARAADILSAKERSSIKVKDEKDILVEKSSSSSIEDVYPGASATSTAALTNSSGLSEFDQTSSSCSSITNNGEQQTKESKQMADEFSGNNLILNPSDFDYLLTKGNNNAPVDRSSLLLKFDPLLGMPVPVNQGQIPFNNNNPYLSPTLEEDEHNDSNQSYAIDDTNAGIAASAKLRVSKERSQEVKQQLQELGEQHQHTQQVQVPQNNKRQLTQGAKKKNATMSVDVIKDMSLDNDCNKAFENSNSTQSDDKQNNYKMDELEKKIKNEVLKTDDIEKKLKDAEQREEALIKRITEKDKTIAKMTGVIEAYEKAIAELIADKEQLTQHYEKQLAEVKADRDSNYHHLTSLETTFSDLHVKYEKSKEMTCQLKESEEALQAEKRKNLENLHLQEQRYDKMKNHAMQQLEIANKKLESLTREHSIEITKLKALLKKEEIARSSINEQLAHKTKENAELVKICDELISGQGSNFSFEPFDSKKH